MDTGSSPAGTVKSEPMPERRTNNRLRMLIDDLKAGVEQNRRELERQAQRIVQMQGELDALKEAR